MKGDIIIISEEHKQAAKQVFDLIGKEALNGHKPYFITVAGESGAGKSETASALAEIMEQNGFNVFVIQQDDFFVHPPKTNADVRVRNNGKAGPEEVRLDLLNGIIRQIRKGTTEITKPLVNFTEDRIDQEIVDTSGYPIFIIEGTYTTLLENIDCKIFIDRNLEDTRADRLKRNREKQDAFLEKILLTEHRIISSHKSLADMIITRDFQAVLNKENT